MLKKNRPIGRKKDIVVQELEGEVLIYDLTSDKAFCLNKTSSLIWQACDGTRDVTAIARLVGKQLNAPPSKDLLLYGLDQLKNEGLVEHTPEPDGRFSGLSRREVIKRLGMGTAVALPIIAALVAPPASEAASSICGMACLTDPNCAPANPNPPHCNNCSNHPVGVPGVCN